ncbi:MAG: hypothetical protein IJ337_01250 [Clostridia bacterium]|nr:hypothetical protein [Clostridia bacterium]
MKYFIKNFLRGIGVATSILCVIAAVACFILTAVGVLMVMGGEITWKVPLVLAGVGILLGAMSYAVSETL